MRFPPLSFVLVTQLLIFKNNTPILLQLPHQMSTKRTRSSSSSSSSAATPIHLLSLGHLHLGTLVHRPSKTLKSPFVADVLLSTGETVLAHTPSLELGGICVPGATLLLSKNRDGLQTAYSVSLVAVSDDESKSRYPSGRYWVSANPHTGNSLARAAIDAGLLSDVGLGCGLAPGGVQSVVAEKTFGDSRLDFEVEEVGGGKILIEVKSVVCSDYMIGSSAPSYKNYANVLSPVSNYRRAAVFPVGKLGQKLQDGTKVLSSRAVKHVRELAAVAEAPPKKKKKGEGGPKTRAAILFVVNRGDCEYLSLEKGTCPVLVDELKRAKKVGVDMKAMRVEWQESEGEWSAKFDGFVDVDI